MDGKRRQRSEGAKKVSVDHGGGVCVLGGGETVSIDIQVWYGLSRS